MKVYKEETKTVTHRIVDKCLCDWCGLEIKQIGDWDDGIEDGHSWFVHNICRSCGKKVGELLEAAGIKVDWWNYSPSKNRFRVEELA